MQIVPGERRQQCNQVRHNGFGHHSIPAAMLLSCEPEKINTRNHLPFRPLKYELES